jgi:hypothetical protein
MPLSVRWDNPDLPTLHGPVLGNDEAGRHPHRHFDLGLGERHQLQVTRARSGARYALHLFHPNCGREFDLISSKTYLSRNDVRILWNNGSMR